ncbi:MAG: SRPBCC family protein [Mycobacterium sp.]|uniref:type II toxin-antitoxin system Rv0910 family toxin n=1 Tax=Mycobacterium sp. TaxID=1785 RepID=UPI001EC623B6|nr:SRPBCC family protein [Mycobacterium sp.]MBW0017739.1 SRPBCC family protein [Mycobacterium sp.]
MAAVELTADVPMSPHDMWDHVSDLSDLGDWLVMHEGWRSELPDEITEGTEIVGVARSKGLRNRVTWTVTKWDPPHEVAMSGSGKGGTKYGVSLTVRHAEDGSRLGLRLELGGRALFGPVGSAAARAVKGDVEKSLRNFVELYGNQS